MATLSGRLSPAVIAFLICGTIAAAVNWFARMILSLWMSFELAVIIAYAIGMLAGFLLYKRYVWRVTDRPLHHQIILFIAVNVVVGLLVLVVAVSLLALGELFVAPSPVLEAIAHGIAIAVGAAANYIAHREITFRAPRLASEA